MLISRRFRPGAKPLSSPETIEVFLRLYLGPLDYEMFGVIHLDGRSRALSQSPLRCSRAQQSRPSDHPPHQRRPGFN